MSEVEVTRKELLTRAEAAERLSALAAALAGDDKVELAFGATTFSMRIPENVHCEIEVEVDDDEVELEVELTWPRGKQGARRVRSAGGR